MRQTRWTTDAGKTDMRQTAGDQVTSQMPGGQTWGRRQVNGQMPEGQTWGSRQVTRWQVRCREDRHEADCRWPGEQSDAGKTDMRQTAGDQVTSQMPGGQTWGRRQVTSQMPGGHTSRDWEWLTINRRMTDWQLTDLSRQHLVENDS